MRADTILPRGRFSCVKKIFGEKQAMVCYVMPSNQKAGAMNFLKIICLLGFLAVGSVSSAMQCELSVDHQVASYTDSITVNGSTSMVTYTGVNSYSIIKMASSESQDLIFEWVVVPAKDFGFDRQIAYRNTKRLPVESSLFKVDGGAYKLTVKLGQAIGFSVSTKAKDNHLYRYSCSPK